VLTIIVPVCDLGMSFGKLDKVQKKIWKIIFKIA